MNTDLDEKSAWTLIKCAFPILDSRCDFLNSPQCNDSAKLELAMYQIQKFDIAKSLQDLMLLRIEDYFRKEAVPRFWSSLTCTSASHREQFERFNSAILDLFESYSKIEKTLQNWNRYSNMQENLVLTVKAALLAQLPADYNDSVWNFYECGWKLNEIDEETESCYVCSGNREQCPCYEAFRETNRKINGMQLQQCLVDQTLTDYTYGLVESHIRKISKDNYDTSLIQTIEKWLQDVVMIWLKDIYMTSENFLQTLHNTLMTYVYNTYTRILIDDLFSIIIEYPESLPALEDLRQSIIQTDLKPYLVKTLQKSMETRLLHPGVSTSDVLTAYIATIRSLRVLDPSGLLMETITKPIHQYLRSRDDTVRCVVTSLTEEGPNDLAEELVRGEAVQLDENGDADEGTENWETWTPDPVECTWDPASQPRTSDIISMLVNVYGSKELFVNEYRTLLADRLLAHYSCDTEKEIRYLELLKLRFGDSQLHYCEVMLKDVQDSKRINQHIRQHAVNAERESVIPLSAMIVSAQFWPVFKEENLELHPNLVEEMESYTTGFETLKGSRTLCWKNHLGIVDLEIECGDRVLNVSVSPIHATILMHFQDNETWTLEALSRKMLAPMTVLRKKLNFWQSQGVIVEKETDVFTLQEEQPNVENNANDDIIVEEYEAESAMASAQDQREEELQTFWSYIQGMLMNLDTLPLDRIHQMLKMFAFQGPTIECSLQELKVFLDRKVREHELIYSNQLYRLPN